MLRSPAPSFSLVLPFVAGSALALTAASAQAAPSPEGEPVLEAEAQAEPEDPFARGGAGAAGGPWSVNIGIGPMINLESGGAMGRTALDFQYHFFGNDTGPALGLQLPMHFRERTFGMTIGPIFLWDFRFIDVGSAALYLAPLISTGWAFTTVSHHHGGGVHHGNHALHAWYLTLGGQFKIIWNGRIGFFVRPISFDVWAGEHFATGYWSLTAGLALNF